MISLRKLFATTGYTKRNTLLRESFNKELGSEISLSLFLPFCLFLFLSPSYLYLLVSRRPPALMKHVGRRSFIFDKSVGRKFFCDIPQRHRRVRERSRGAICIFGVVNTSVAYRERPGAYFQAPYINPLFNTPLSARPGGKEGERG